MRTRLSDRWRAWLARSLPDRESLAAHPWLKPFAHRLLEPRLWRMQHEALARGVAIGIFWAFAVPFAQILLAAAHCIWWRANIPVAAGITLITNPFTVGFWLWLAYQLGAWLLNAPALVPRAESDSLLAWMTSLGGPAILGMGLFAVGGALLGYAAVKLGWRLRVWLKRRHR